MKTKTKLIDRLQRAADFSNKKCLIYQKIVKDLNSKLDTTLPTE